MFLQRTNVEICLLIDLLSHAEIERMLTLFGMQAQKI
jgi:hypothetical protein